MSTSVIRGVNDEAVWIKHREELTRYASMLVGTADVLDVACPAKTSSTN